MVSKFTFALCVSHECGMMTIYLRHKIRNEVMLKIFPLVIPYLMSLCASIKLRVLQEAKIAITVWYTIISLNTYNTKLGLWKPVSLECLSGTHNKFSNQTYHYKHPLLDWKIAWPLLIFSNLFEMPIQLNDVCKMLVVGIIITQYYKVSQLIQCLRMGLLLDT